MCIYSPMPHTLSYCALIGKCALIRSNTVYYPWLAKIGNPQGMQLEINIDYFDVESMLIQCFVPGEKPY